MNTHFLLMAEFEQADIPPLENELHRLKYPCG